MNLLGIDYGRKKIGIALATSKIAEPYGVIRFNSINEALEKIKKIIIVEVPEVEKIVLGISEGKAAKETRMFGKKITEKLKIPVNFSDETLSTESAKNLSIEARVAKKRRKKLEDAFAATLMLQSFVDNNV